MLRGAAASLHAALASVDKDAGNLRRALRKSRRREQWRAAALVLPLFVFLAACFVLPIGAQRAAHVVRFVELTVLRGTYRLSVPVSINSLFPVRRLAIIMLLFFLAPKGFTQAKHVPSSRGGAIFASIVRRQVFPKYKGTMP